MPLKTTSVYKKKDQHNHNTRGAQNVLLDLYIISTSRYGSNSIKSHSILNWNYLIKKVKFIPDMRRTQFIAAIKKFPAYVSVHKLCMCTYNMVLCS